MLEMLRFHHLWQLADTYATTSIAKLLISGSWVRTPQRLPFFIRFSCFTGLDTQQAVGRSVGIS